MSPAVPPVTVLLPVHNGERWLAEALDSVLAQTFADFTLLVLDDASTDGSAEIARSRDDERIEVVPSPTNLGIATTLNRGLQLTASPYVARMDADDVSLPERLARQVGFLDANPGVAVVGGHWLPIDEEGRLLAGTPPPLPTGPDEIRWRLWFWNCVAHPTVLARREALARSGGYDGAWWPSEDYDLWLRLVCTGMQIANLPDVVLHYRRHPGAASLIGAGSSGDRDVTIAARQLSSIVGSEVHEAALRLLRSPAFGASRADRTAAARALGALSAWAGPRAGARRSVASLLARLAAGTGAVEVVGAYRAGRRRSFS